MMSILASVIIVVGGCSSDWRTSYGSAYADNTAIATANCEQYGQIYMIHYYNIQDSSWHTICKQKSPEKLIDKKVMVNPNES